MTGEGELKLLPSVTCVKICAFMGCGELQRVIWPSRLGWIEDAAFCATGLEEAVLPEGLKGIGEDGFCNCGALRKVSFADVREFRPGALNWLRDAVVSVAGKRIDAVTYSHV